MKCPDCHHPRSKVIDTANSAKPTRYTSLRAAITTAFELFGGGVARKRECQNCSHRFFTLEINLPTLSKKVGDAIETTCATPAKFDISLLAEAVKETTAALERKAR